MTILRLAAELRDRWRADSPELVLERRLKAVGFPLMVRRALRDAATPSPELSTWVREALRRGWILRTAQAERIADGRSLEWTARTTGVSVHLVVHYLAIPPWEDDEDRIDAANVIQLAGRNGDAT